MSGRPTYLDNSRAGPPMLAVGAGWVVQLVFSRLPYLFSFFPFLWETEILFERVVKQKKNKKQPAQNALVMKLIRYISSEAHTGHHFDNVHKQSLLTMVFRTP